MSYNLPNVGRLQAAQEKAAALALLGHRQNTVAELLVYCPEDHLVARVFDLPEGQLVVPKGRVRASRPNRDGPSVHVWGEAYPYWLSDCAQDDVIGARCRCAEVQKILVADLHGHLGRRSRTMRLASPVR